MKLEIEDDAAACSMAKFYNVDVRFMVGESRRAAGAPHEGDITVREQGEIVLFVTLRGCFAIRVDAVNFG